MAYESESSLNKKTQTKNIESPQYSAPTNFLIGFFFGSFVFLLLLGSMEMTHTPLADVGTAKLIFTAMVPFICGAIAVRFKHNFIDSFTDLLSSVGNSLPF
ncbi:MAG: hypothetical protein WA901_16155 [Phormidesmis sp.]